MNTCQLLWQLSMNKNLNTVLAAQNNPLMHLNKMRHKIQNAALQKVYLHNKVYIFYTFLHMKTHSSEHQLYYYLFETTKS